MSHERASDVAPGGGGGGGAKGTAASGGAGAAADAAASPRVDAPGFDVEAVRSGYSGYGRLARLKFIAGRATGEVSRAAAFALIEVLKAEGWNTALYREVIETLPDDQLDEEHALDLAWVESADKEAEKTLTFLDRTLNTHKANMVKESIRASFNELATFHEQRNELSTALQCYNKQEYYCSAPTHEMERAVNGARVALLSGELRSAETFVAKAEALLERDLKRASADSSGRAPDFDAVAVSKVRVLAGLVALSSKDYRRAAWNLWDADLALGDSFNDVLAARDIGMIAGLCALASYDRIQLRERVLKPRSDDARSGAPLLERPPNAESVKGFLELAPVVRDVLQDFGASRYASCLCALDELRPSLKLDLWLSRHVEALYDQIRTAAILQYFAPYSKVSMVAMAESFRTSVDELEAELARLIMSDQLQARIDSQNKLLQTRRTDERVATFQRAFEVGAQFTQDIKAMVLRANLEKRGLEIRAPRHGRAGGASEPLGAVEGGAYYDAGDGDYMGDDMGPGGGGGAGDMHP